MLGVGAAATLAAWNDSDFGSGTFTAGTFDITGSTDGTTFSQHPTSPGAAMTFRVTTTASAMTPGDTVYALFSVKTQSSLSMAGTVLLKANAANNGGLGAYLTYRVKTISGTTCDSTTFPGGTDVPGLATGQPLTTGAASAQTLAAGGAQINYCFAVTLPLGAATTAQGTSLTATWEFAATSTP